MQFSREVQTILFDARSITPKPCGVRHVTENYLKEFQSNYCVISIINKRSKNIIDPRIRTIVLPNIFSRFNFLTDFVISLLCLRYKPDIFFSGHSFIPVLAFFLPAKRIFICHDLFAAFDRDFFKSKGWRAPFARFYFRVLLELSFYRSTLVIAPSDAIRNSFQKLTVRPKRVVTVRNGVIVRKSEGNLPPKKCELLFVGNFRRYKGFDILMSAWQDICHTSEMANWSLRVVSNESQESFELFLQQYQNSRGVHFHSRISDAELQRLRDGSSIFIVPSRKEGFGLPLIEALASRGFVICSDIEVFRELVTDFDNSVIRMFESEDANDLGHCILNIAGNLDEKAMNTGAERNAGLIRDIFSWSSAAEKVREEIG